jgi:Glycosyl transferases group 1
MRGFAASAIDKRIRALQLSGTVQMTGWIPREELYDLYRRAWAFIYPSRFEGFGKSVTEAMAAGVPVACSDIEPLRSIARDAALLDSKWFDYLRLRFTHGSTRMAPCWLDVWHRTNNTTVFADLRISRLTYCSSVGGTGDKLYRSFTEREASPTRHKPDLLRV